jgi:hypothetical protein
MHGELVFTALPGQATPAQRRTLADAGLRERADLQEWIRHNPTILGAGVRIVTYEFDRWISGSGTHSDRLDLLGLDTSGRLVVAELKRDGAPDTVEMQAVKYAAYASRFTPETLGACHGHFLRKTTDESITDEEALAQLDEHCGGLDPDLLRSPRIVLVASAFPAPVTAAVVWLCEQGLDISLIEVAAYQARPRPHRDCLADLADRRCGRVHRHAKRSLPTHARYPQAQHSQCRHHHPRGRTDQRRECR